MLDLVTPKIADISSIKGVSTLLALPMLCVAYFLQTGASISWDDTVWLGLGENLSAETELRRLVLIFVLKSIWISFFGALVYAALTHLYISVDFPVLQLSATLMIGFALFGIFCSPKFAQLKLIDPFWFYGLIVWGVFLQTMKEQLDERRRKIEAKLEARRKERSNGA